jgi:aminotransferase class V
VDIASAQALWGGRPGWLNTASYGLPPRPGWEALQAALAQWRQGTGVWEEWQSVTEQTRASFARLLGVTPDQVFSGSTVSAALGLVAGTVPDGATVLVPDFEFASDVFPWRAHADRGVSVVGAPLADLADRIDVGVDVVAFALVQSASGEVADLPAISAAARDAGALVVVDATQALGWLPFDVRLTDACVAATYKWLMTPRGATLGYFSPELQDRVRPGQTGWSAATDDFYYGLNAAPFADARRFDQAPAWFTHVAAAPTLQLIEEIGVAAINGPRRDAGQPVPRGPWPGARQLGDRLGRPARRGGAAGRGRPACLGQGRPGPALLPRLQHTGRRGSRAGRPGRTRTMTPQPAGRPAGAPRQRRVSGPGSPPCPWTAWSSPSRGRTRRACTSRSHGTPNHSTRTCSSQKR